MMWLVTNDDTAVLSKQDQEPIRFIQYESEPETRTKDRRKPPEEPPDPPPPPKSPEPVAQQQQQARAPMPQMDMPNMDIDMGTGSGPFVGDFSTGETGIDTDATPISRVPPQYPLEARREGVQGYVTMEFTIRPDGSVTDITVVGSHPKGTFEKAAKRALARWKFEPREEGGRKVSRRARQTIRFTLGSG
ncbi:MAG: TonB family protein [Halofilum sp. (in: g-proteobacteria)]|nr:TonB family protein [Halofilum sp. (in: g-proteobacteria)]